MRTLRDEKGYWTIQGLTDNDLYPVLYSSLHYSRGNPKGKVVLPGFFYGPDGMGALTFCFIDMRFPVFVCPVTGHHLDELLELSELS